MKSQAVLGSQLAGLFYPLLTHFIKTIFQENIVMTEDTIKNFVIPKSSN